MEVAARITARVAFMTAMSAAMGCGAHGSSAERANVPRSLSSSQTTSATIAVATVAAAPAPAPAALDDGAASAKAIPVASDEDDEFDEMPLFKRPTTFREFLELIAASAETDKPERH